MSDIVSEEWMDEHPFSFEMVAQAGVRLWHKLRDTPKLRLGIYYEEGCSDSLRIKGNDNRVMCSFRTGGEDREWYKEIKKNRLRET